MDPSDLRAELAERLANSTPLDAQTLNSACFMLSRALEGLEFSTPEAAPLARRLLRVVGRVVIDAAGPDSSPDVWPNTKEMALQWIDEALHALGYEATPGSAG
jgi:hypothetical protein